MSCSSDIQKFDGFKKNTDQSKNVKKHECEVPFFYFKDFQDKYIQIECFDLAKIPIKNKDRFVYGSHYFCDFENFEKDGNIEVFSNGVIKIEGKYHFLVPILIYEGKVYFFDGDYIVESISEYADQDKCELIIYDIKNETKFSYNFYYRWYCEL